MIVHNSTSSLALTGFGTYADAVEAVDFYVNENLWVGQYSGDGEHHEINQVFYRFDVGQADHSLTSAKLILTVQEIYGHHEIVVFEHDWSEITTAFVKASQFASKTELGRFEIGEGDAAGQWVVDLDLPADFAGELSVALVSDKQGSMTPSSDDTTLVVSTAKIEAIYETTALEAIVASGSSTFTLSGAAKASLAIKSVASGLLKLTGVGAGLTSVSASGSSLIVLTGSGSSSSSITGSAHAFLAIVGSGVSTPVLKSSGSSTISLTGSGRAVVRRPLRVDPEAIVQIQNIGGVLTLDNPSHILRVTL